MIIRVALWLFLLCLPLFLVAKALLIFAFFIVASFAMQGAIFLMFAAFGLFIFSGLIFTIKSVWRIFRQYFSTEEREQRHILFVKNQTQNRQRLFHFQRLQLNYFREHQRKKILQQHNSKEINALFKLIEQNLKRVKSQLSKTEFLQFRRENRRYHAQQNEQALLELHHKIVTMTSK